jgi:predicted nucleic acid-binding protein
LIYLDTSVVVAYYCPEHISDLSESIIRGKQPCFLSDLTEVEFFSAISRKIRQRELSSTDAATVRHHFVTHLNDGVYRRTSLGPHHVLRARGFLTDFVTALRTLDAMHLAIVSLDGLRLVTADESFFQSAKTLSISARLLR